MKNGRFISEVPVLISHLFPELYLSSRGGTRTPDPVINSHLLYHLSYSGIALEISRSKHQNQPTLELLRDRNSNKISIR